MMIEITIGTAKLTSSNSVLTIESIDDQESPITFDAEGVRELIRFLTSQTTSSFNRREAFRVPVFESSGLELQIRFGDQVLLGRPTSISMTGAFVSVTADDPLAIKVDQEVEATLMFEGKQHVHPSIVRRVAADGFGIGFLDAVSDGQIDPPADIARIVMALQRQWAARTA